MREKGGRRERRERGKILIKLFHVCVCRLRKNFISKQAKSKEEIEQLKRKVERYEEQLHELKQGRVTHSHPFSRINRMKYLG